MSVIVGCVLARGNSRRSMSASPPFFSTTPTSLPSETRICFCFEWLLLIWPSSLPPLPALQNHNFSLGQRRSLITCGLPFCCVPLTDCLVSSSSLSLALSLDGRFQPRNDPYKVCESLELFSNCELSIHRCSAFCLHIRPPGEGGRW